MMSGQQYNGFLDAYQYNKYFQNQPVKNSNEYQDIEGSPFLNTEFSEGIIYLKDTTAVKLPMRYNIYTDEMEYQLKGVTYVVGDPKFLNKIVLGKSVFIYLPYFLKGCYVELLESGKCFLLLRRSVTFHPAEGPKPVEGVSRPAGFTKDPDAFYYLVGSSKPVEIFTMKSVLNALQDQKLKIESYIKTEKINKTKKENLIKIAKYYNSL